MLFTIGYSDFFELDKFIDTLKKNSIDILIDIRTFPYSSTFPQYDENNLKNSLKSHSIEHLFLGDYIGGLKIKTLVKKGVSKAEDLLNDEEFKIGMRKLYTLSRNKNVCVMCAEKEPFDCHRLYVSYLFHKRTGEEVVNLFSNKSETLSQTINRFKKQHKLDNINIDDEKLIAERFKLLYKIQNKREERYPETFKNFSLFEK